MSDVSMFQLVRRPAVAGRKSLGSLTLEAVTDGTVLQLLGRPGTAGEALAAALGDLSSVSLRATAPGQWFLVSDAPVDIDGLSDRLAGVAFVVDQTHGRSRFRLQGAKVRQWLAKGTGVDLHPDQFPIGHAATTLIGHIGVNLARTGEDRYELLVLRGFADSLWHDLNIIGAEFLI